MTNGATPVTTGTVAFTDGATSLGAAVALDASGQATLTTSALTAATHTITATFNETAQLATSNDSIDQVVSNADTMTTLTSSANPSFFGLSVTFTATVTVTNGPSLGAVPTGTITFTDGATTLGATALDASGQATFTTSTFAVGTHTVTATYGGANGLAVSDASVAQVVANADSATTLISSLNPSNFGQAVTFTATVTITSGPANGGPATTGTVTFTDGGTNLGPPVAIDASGQATFTTSALAVGTHGIGASYSGATGLTNSGAVLEQVVDGVADAGGPYAITEGDPLTLDGTASLAGPGATYSWDVNDDGTFGDATGATPTLTWADLEALGLDGDGLPHATHTVTLRLTDVLTFTAVTPLTIANVAPTATLANDGPVAEGSTATVTFSGQSDPSAQDLAALTYSYDFDDDGTFEVVDSASDSAVVPASFIADGPATYTIRGRVADDDGGSLDLTTDITVTNTAATATITGPSTATVGVPVTLKVGADDPSPGDMAGTFAFTVDWGDGSPIVTASGPADPR